MRAASRHIFRRHQLVYLSAVATCCKRGHVTTCNFSPLLPCCCSFRPYSVAVMSSRRSGRVAALQLSKPAVSYKEVNSEDEASEQPSDSVTGRTKGRRGAAATNQLRPNGKHAQEQTDEQQQQDGDDDVIVVEVEDDEVNEVAAIVERQKQVVDRTRVTTPSEADEEAGEEKSAARSKKRQRTVSAQQSQPAQKEQRRTQRLQAEAEQVQSAEASTEGAEEEEGETKPAKGKKRKAAATKDRRGKKAAAGDANDPIALDEDEEADKGKLQKAKKPTKPKKEKQPALLPHIRPVSTALGQSRKLIGAHVGTSGGVHFGPHNAALMGARCFAMDTRSKRRWASVPYTPSIIQSFHSHMQHYGYSGDVVLPHGSYLTNLGCLSDQLWEKSKACITEELERCQQLGVTRYVFHPGRASTSGEEREEEIRAEKEKKKEAREKAREKARERKKRLKAGEEVSEDEEEEADTATSQPAVDPSEYLFTSSTPAAVRSYITSQPAIRIRSLARLVTALNELLSPSASATYANVHILIETMAGTGNQLCSRFEELRYVIDAVHAVQQDAASPSRIGVCIDTCHVFAADERYDMRQRAGYERVMKEVEDIIGWQYVKGMHMNDSKCGLGSRRDRHENIGDGEVRHITHTMPATRTRGVQDTGLASSTCRSRAEPKPRKKKGKAQRKRKTESSDSDSSVEGGDESSEYDPSE